MSALIIDASTGAATTRPLTAAELAAQQAAAAAAQQAAQQAAADAAVDTSDRADRATLVQQLQADYAALTDTTQTLTSAQLRAILARTIRCQALFLRIVGRRGL